MSTKFSIGQMNQLADALEAAGFTPADVTKLRSPEMLSKFKLVLGKKAEIVSKKHLIDCDADPFVPDGWEVIDHRKGGKIEWDLDKIELYLCDEQKSGSIKGNELREKLEGKPVLNACVLDYLLAHPELISNEWKGKRIFFWGTIYRRSDGYLCVRCLFWSGRVWDWNVPWLGLRWYDDAPVALCK